MFRIVATVLKVFPAKGKGPRRVVCISDDGRFTQVFDSFDHSQQIEVGKVINLPVAIKLDDYKGVKSIKVTNWPDKKG